MTADGVLVEKIVVVRRFQFFEVVKFVGFSGMFGGSGI